MKKKIQIKEEISTNSVSRREFLRKSGRTVLIIGGLGITGGSILAGIQSCNKNDPSGPNNY